MAEQNFTPIRPAQDQFDLASLLGQMPIVQNPQTGESGVVIQDKTKKEKKLQKALAPMPPANVQKVSLPYDVSQPVGNDDQQFKDYFQKQRALADEALAQERLGIGKLEEQKAQMQALSQDPAYAMAHQVDWKPLASYLDTMVKGGKLAENTTQFVSPQDRAKLQANLENMIQEKRGELTKNQLKVLATEIEKKGMENSSRTARMMYQTDLKMFNTARGEQAKLVKDATEFRQNYFNTEDAITPDEKGTVSVGRVHQALSSFARLMGEKGVLTDTDIGRQLKPTIDTMLAGWGATLQSNPNARLDAKNVAAIKDALNAAKKAYAQKYQMQADVFKSTYFDNPDSPYAGKGWAGQMIADTYKPLDLIQGTGKEKIAPTGKEVVKENFDMQKAAIEEMKRRKGSK
jgi:hypothetical protein